MRIVTWLMTSSDPERSRSWHQYAYGSISRKWLEIQTWFQWTTLIFEWSRDWWRQVTIGVTTLTFQGHLTIGHVTIWFPVSHFLLVLHWHISSRFRDNGPQIYQGWRYCMSMEHRQEMATWPMVIWPWKVKVVTPICLWLNISKMAGDTDLVPMDHQYRRFEWSRDW